jgi:predicted nuclease of predicted toxin-antitoxin system
MQWAKDNGYVVFTHDLDFGTLLYATGATAPSVVQFRMQDVRPAVVGAMVVSSLNQVMEHLLAGALITIDPAKVRFHMLPLKNRK